MATRWSRQEEDLQTQKEAGAISKDPLAPFYRMCRDYPVLSRKELVKLLAEYRAGSLEAGDRIVYCNVGLSIKWAARFARRGAPMEDLVQEGLNATREQALPKFDETCNTEFSTYASWWIRNAMARYIANYGTQRAFRTPVHLEELVQRIAKIERRFYGKHGRQPNDVETVSEMRASIESATEKRLREKFERQPTAEELADACAAIPAYRVTPERVYEIRLRDSKAISTETVITDKQSDRIRTVGDMIPDRQWQDGFTEVGSIRVDAEWATEQLRTRLKCMRPKTKEVFRRRFGLDGHERETLEVTGAALGLTRERIRQIEMKELNRISKQTGLSAKLVKTAFIAMGERASPSDMDGENADGWSADRLEDAFQKLCEHGVDPKETGTFRILYPARTLRARLDVNRPSAERLVETMVSHEWLTPVVGQDAVTILRADVLKRLREAQNPKTAKTSKEALKTVPTPSHPRKERIIRSTRTSKMDVLAFLTEHAVLVAGERVVRGPLLLVQARLGLKMTHAEQALSQLADEKKIASRDEWRSIVIQVPQAPTPEPSHVECAVPDEMPTAAESMVRIVPSTAETVVVAPSVEPPLIDDRVRRHLSTEPIVESMPPPEPEREVVETVETPVPAAVEQPVPELSSHETRSEPSEAVISLEQPEKTSSVEAYRRRRRARMATPPSAPNPTREEKILVAAGMEIGYGAAIALLREAKRAAESYPLVVDRDAIFVNALGSSWISENGVVQQLATPPLGIEPSVTRTWFATHGPTLRSITVRDREWRTRVLYAVSDICRTLFLPR